MNIDKIKVLVVDDSPTARQLLSFIIESDSQLKVIGFAENGLQALEVLETMQSDVITMDIVMPKLDGFETTRKIMNTLPIPIIIISGIYTKGDIQKSFRAMEAGALAILKKPKGLQDPAFNIDKKNLISTIKIVAKANVSKLRQKISRQVATNEVPETFLNSTLGHQYLEHLMQNKIEAVAIGSSLGGPQALSAILAKLPVTFPVPIFIVQHISPGFVMGLIEWLGTQTSLKVKLAEDKEKAIAGCVYVAPDHFHMELRKNHHIALVSDSNTDRVKPSVGRLFRSVSDAYGSRCVGIILTGMGKDGAHDLLYMRQRGGETIAQDQESCVMFGMPKEAIEMGGQSMSFLYCKLLLI